VASTFISQNVPLGRLNSRMLPRMASQLSKPEFVMDRQTVMTPMCCNASIATCHSYEASHW
jgi:hypothetical protein